MLTVGADYALARKTTWIFAGGGVDFRTVVVTRTAVYAFPRAEAEALEALLAGPATIAKKLDAELVRRAEAVDIRVAEPLSSFRRILVYRGWFRRSVVLSKKAKGFDARPASIHPTKDEMPAFVELLRELPQVELK